MTTAEWIALAAVLEAPAGAALIWIWRVHDVANEALRRAKDIENARAIDKPAYDARLSKVESVASDVRDLTGAIKHMGEMTSAQLRNLEERQDDHNDWLKGEIGRLAQEQKHIKTAVEAVREGRQRREN